MAVEYRDLLVEITRARHVGSVTPRISGACWRRIDFTGWRPVALACSVPVEVFLGDTGELGGAP